MADITFHIDRTTFDHGASVIHTLNASAAPSGDAEILRDIRDAVRALSDREPLIADALDDLREAVEKKDQPSVRKWIGRLASGTTAEVLKGVASKGLLAFLGLA